MPLLLLTLMWPANETCSRPELSFSHQTGADHDPTRARKRQLLESDGHVTPFNALDSLATVGPT